MDHHHHLQPSANYHHHPPPRYNNLPILPLSPSHHNPQSRFPSNPTNPTIYQNYRHLPPPPPPPPQSFHPLPAPPPPLPYNPHQSQFTFSSNDHRMFVKMPQRDFNRVEHRIDRPSRLEYDIENGYSSNRVVNQLDSGYRYREDFSSNHRMVDSREDDPIRGSFGNSDKFRDLSSSYSRGLDEASRKIEVREGLGYDGKCNKRFGYYRQQESLREGVDIDMLGGGIRMDEFIDNGDDERVVFRKRVSRSSRGNECTPLKQVQKKSAFLRIQMGKSGVRNRDEVQFQSPGYFDELSSSPYRGKQQHSGVNKDQKVEEGGDGREGSPVELDVSFKSNSLVAKAIMMSPSSPAVNLTPKSRKIRKLTMSDGKDSSSCRSNVSSDSGKTGVSGDHLDGSPCSGKDKLRLVGKDAVTGSVAAADIRVKPCFDGTVTPLGKRSAVRSPGDKVSAKGSNNRSGGKSLPRVTKRKKVMKKGSPAGSNLLKPQPSEELNEFKKASSSASSKSDKEIIPAKDETNDNDLQLVPNKLLVPAESNISNVSPQNVPLGEVGTDTDSNNESSFTTIKDRDSSTLLLGPSSPKEINNNGGPGDADRAVNGLFFIPVSDGILALQNNTSSSDIGAVDNTRKQSIQSKTGSVDGYANIGMSNSVENNINRTSGLGTNCFSSSDSDLIKLHANIALSNTDTLDGDSKQPCLNQVGSFLGHGLMEGVKKNVSSKENSVHEEPLCSTTSNCRGTYLSSDNGLDNLQAFLSVSNNSGCDGTGSQPCPRRGTISVENEAMEGCSNTSDCLDEIFNTSLDKECIPNIKKNKRKERNTQFSSLDTSMVETEPKNVVTSPKSSNANIKLLVQDLCPVNEEVSFSCVKNLDIHSQPCSIGVSVCEKNGIMDEFPTNVVPSSAEENSVVISPTSTFTKSGKKRKLSAHYSSLSSSVRADINEEPWDKDVSTSNAEGCLNFKKGVAESEENAVATILNAKNASLFPFIEQVVVFPRDGVAGESSEVLDLVKDGFSNNTSSVEDREVISGSKTMVIAPDVLSPCSSGLGGEQTENTTSLMATTNQIASLDLESVKEHESDMHLVEEQVTGNSKNVPFELQISDSDQILHDTDKEFENMLSEKENLLSISNYNFFSAPGDEFTINDELMESKPDKLSVVGSPESIEPIIKVLSSRLSCVETSYGDDCREEKSVVGINFDHGKKYDKSSSLKALKMPAQDTITKGTTHIQKSTSVAFKFLANHPSHTASRFYSGRSSVIYTNSKNTASSAHITKSRTWHKSSDPCSTPLSGKKSTIPPPKQMSKQDGKINNSSYIRRGNSLVRKPSAASTPAQGSYDLSSIISSGIGKRNKTGCGSMVDVAKPLNSSRKMEINAALSTPQIYKLLPRVKSSECIVGSSQNHACSPLNEPLVLTNSGTTSDPMICLEEKGILESSTGAMKSSGMPENKTAKRLEMQCMLNDGSSISSKLKTITYVKNKSNQLVAASRHNNPSVQKRTQALYSDGYYKKRINQLVRLPLEADKQESIFDESSKPEEQRTQKVTPITNRRQSGKGSSYKPSELALVWTLRGTQSSKDINNSLQRNVLPHRFPWKRTSNWKNFMQNSSLLSRNSSSMISRRLLLLRRRDTLYTRSTHGLSLRKSKVLSVGGSSLKWSKSIEMRSKKVSEEATRAVAAAEREKREQSGAGCVTSAAKTRNQSSRKSANSIKLRSGDRIFRIGSFRYRMDSSKKTLRRIPDESSLPDDAVQDEDAKTSYVPRRLVIGNEQYVRIGNGNQLIRDPKKRARTLASEKVRWSLHTARLRLARKRKYCQFFTRFGKCNKNDGKCPYIHDPSKVSVCTKFLKGLCSNPDCKLTHQVIPERMPDCSFFLLGLCSNENCPYRHVNVNPNAPTCEGFLKGYCADGNECRKKHSYVCPVFEATGTCPQGSKCKLHHPKKSKGKKKKLSREEKNGQGRYFGSPLIDVVDSRVVTLEKHSTLRNNNTSFNGEAVDYISLDVSDEDTEEATISIRTAMFDSNSMDLEDDALDELIKPICIMKRNLTA